MLEIENPVVMLDVPVQVGDKVWFIADDELYGGMVFDGEVTEVTLTSMRVFTSAPNSDTWTLPLSWFKEGNAFTDELTLMQSLLDSWIEQTIKANKEKNELSERLRTVANERNAAQRRIADLEFELSKLRGDA